MSIGSTQPFRPAGTATLAASTTSAAVVLPGSGEAVLVYNASADIAFVAFGTTSAVLATVQDTPIPPGARMLIHAGGGFIRAAAAVLSQGSGTVYFTQGEGTVY